MKNWTKTSLFTVFFILLLSVGVFYLFNISLSIPSSDIQFSPGKHYSKIEIDSASTKPKNIILFIADGMGFGHLTLALHTQQKENSQSIWNQFDVKGWHDARSVIGPLTDSEASATAMATGTSTNFGHIGIDKDGNSLENIFEIAAAKGYSTGIVTDSYIWDGTPAAFSAHTTDEDDARSIITQIAASELDVLFGELEDLGEGDVPEKDESLEILTQRFTLLDETLGVPKELDSSAPIAAIFDEDAVQDLNSSPNLTQMTQVALKRLSDQTKPFVLLVECEELDSASHENDSKRVVEGLKSIQQTLSVVLDHVKKDEETLIVFTADHETGGLAAVADFDSYPSMQIKWSTKEHSAAVVPLFAHGPGSSYFGKVHRNRQIGVLLKKLVEGNNTITNP